MKVTNLNIKGIEFSITSDRNAWGDGAHETTAFMLDAISRYMDKDKTVLDIGTGTGVLSVLCSKLGASFVLALDNNPNVLDTAELNFKSNNVTVATMLNNLTTGIGYKYDIVLANLERSVQLSNVLSVGRVVQDDGILIMTWKNTDSFEWFRKEFELIEHVVGKDYDGYVLRKK